jgi:hypothetical protein
MSSFFRAILGFLDYKLPILDVSHLEHPCLKVSGQLALNLLKDGPDRLSVLYKLTDILI